MNWKEVVITSYVWLFTMWASYNIGLSWWLVIPVFSAIFATIVTFLPKSKMEESN